MSKSIKKGGSIRREFAGYAVPSVLGMVVSSLYTIIDGIFVGRGVGDTALGAVNIAFPFIMLQIAVAMLISVGGANHFSISRGRGDNENANNIFLQSIYLMTGLGIFMNIIVLMFTKEVCGLLGADAELLPYASDYIWWIAFFGIIFLPGLGLSIFLRNDNAPRRELVGTLSGTITNIVLDYLFIMVFDMGVKGAAIATGIGQTISIAVYMTHFLKKDRVLRFGKAKWNLSDIKKILSSGIPSFLMEFSQSAVAYSFNLVLMAKIGADGVSFYSIVMYICSMFNMVLIGLTQGAQPLMSFRYGVGDKDAVMEVRNLAANTAIISTTLIYGLILFFGEGLASIFVPGSANAAASAANMMKYYFLAFFPIGVTLLNILYFQVTEEKKQSILLSFLRCFGFIQVFLFVLPPVFGNIGIYLAFPCGELCHFILSKFMMRSLAKTKASKTLSEASAV